MREILNYPKIDNEKLEIVKNLIDKIAENYNSDNCKELDELSHITGKVHEEIEFAEYWEWTDLDILAERTLTPEPPYIYNLTKDEIKEIVVIVKDCLISGMDNKADYYMELLHKSLPLTNVIAFITSEDNVEKIVDNMMIASANSVILL